MSQKQNLNHGYHFEKLNHNAIANPSSLASAVSAAIGSSHKTKSFVDTWLLFIRILAKEVAGVKPDANNSSVINSKWYQHSKQILITMIEENQYVDILGQFEHEFIMKDLAVYDSYYLNCSQIVEPYSKELISEAIKLRGQFKFGNTNAGTGITVLKLAKKFVEFGIDIQKLYAECYETNQHVYNLCLIQLHHAKIRFSIQLEKVNEPKPELFNFIFGNYMTKEIIGIRERR